MITISDHPAYISIPKHLMVTIYYCILLEGMHSTHTVGVGFLCSSSPNALTGDLYGEIQYSVYIC